jgi:uncharacterized protein
MAPRTVIMAGVLGGLLAGGDAAQAQSPPPVTVLHLSAEETVQVTPDQLVANLVAQNTSRSPSTAQRTVNELITAGLKAAKDVQTVQAHAIGYSVVPTDDKRTTWTARQTLELRGTDGTALLDLTGKLQQQWFVAGSLDWQVSPALRRKAHDQATTAALKELQARAASAAETLGLRVDHAQDVRLDGPAYQPRPQFATMAMAARAAPAPQASAAPEDVTATVSAEYVLRP